MAAISVPALALGTAVTQGALGANLLVVPGRYASSVMSGQVGTSATAPRNATVFH